jgi:hypothetical protein
LNLGSLVHGGVEGFLGVLHLNAAGVVERSPGLALPDVRLLNLPLGKLEIQFNGLTVSVVHFGALHRGTVLLSRIYLLFSKEISVLIGLFEGSSIAQNIGFILIELDDL